MKKPLLGPCDSFQLEPFEYEWAWTMARECEHNTWTPEEIPVAQDVETYKAPDLNPAAKHLFESVMAQLTTFDIQRGDDAAETFLSILQPAEIKHFLKRLVWEEALHTRSYRYIIENLGIPLEIYDRWHTVDSMRERVEYAEDISAAVQGLYNDMMYPKLNQTCIRFTWEWQHKAIMLRALIFWFLIFEGIWFWINLLGPVQALARQGLFKGAAEQLQYIARDESQHIRFGVELIRAFISQHEEIVTESFQRDITRMFEHCIQLEADYANYCHSAGPILGYSVLDHVETARYFANMRARSIGFPEPFPGAQHKFPWMAEQMELKKEKNFFEQRVTEYRAGGALQFDEQDSIDSISDWTCPASRIGEEGEI